MTIHPFFNIISYLESLNIDTSGLENKPMIVINLKNLLSEVCSVLKDNIININLEKWSGRGNKEIERIKEMEEEITKRIEK